MESPRVNKRTRQDRSATSRVEHALSRMGLKEKEVRVFLSLLELGPSPVRTIAARSRINRGTTYEVLRWLIEAGLVSYFHKTRHQYFAAEDPNKLVALLDLRLQELERTKRIVADVVPLLTVRTAGNERQPRVRFFEGQAGIHALLEDVLATMKGENEKLYRVYSSADIRQHLYLSFSDFSQKRVTLGIHVKTIAIGTGGKLWGLDERRWLTTTEQALTYQIIYGGKLAMISLDQGGRPVGAILEDPRIANTQRFIFDQLWATLKPSHARLR
ncbi:MAG: TrmB family transcriptional regulator [Candidatus Kerfeldbacteria bacterium]|nr:TrmB family transcriptional regulator [Candidatus Kerfeldbacteria bacterium]